MPFDGLTSLDYENLERLDQVIGLIATPAQWCKGEERNSHGQYCIRGAMRAAGAFDALEPIVVHSIHKITGQRYKKIEAFNDDPRTTHADVLRVLNRARKLILDGEGGVSRTKATAKTGACAAVNWIARFWRQHLV